MPEPILCSILLDTAHDRRSPCLCAVNSSVGLRSQHKSRRACSARRAAIRFARVIARGTAGLQLVHQLAPGRTSTFVHHRTGKIIVVTSLRLSSSLALGDPCHLPTVQRVREPG